MWFLIGSLMVLLIVLARSVRQITHLVSQLKLERAEERRTLFELISLVKGWVVSNEHRASDAVNELKRATDIVAEVPAKVVEVLTNTKGG